MDIPQHPDCRPSAPPLVSLSALTAVHHAAEDCLSAVPTGFVSQLEGFGRVAPAGLRDCGHGRTQGLVALAGLRTLGSGKGRPAGACPAARQLAKGLDYRGIIPYPALHGIKRPHCGKEPYCDKELCCGSPLQGFGIVGTSEPRVWSPLQGYAPWALKRVAPLGLTPQLVDN